MPALAIRSVVDALREALQERIVSGAIAPGAALPEETVAQMFDVARPSARAAIEQLVALGLLRRAPNKTARVPRLDAGDVADLYLSRTAIEQAAVALLAQRRHVPLAAEQALSTLRTAIEKRSDRGVVDIVASDIEFHRALVAGCGSPRLRRLHDAVIGEAHLCMAQVQLQHLLDPSVIAEEHRRILAMLAKGDVERAGRDMAAHLARARKKLAHWLETNAGTSIAAADA